MSGEENQINWRGVQPVDGIRGIWPEAASERIYKLGLAAGIVIGNMYTVPGGKVLFISNTMHNARLSADAAGAAFAYVRNVADVTVFYFSYFMFDIAGQIVNSQYHFPALEVQAGYDVCLSNNHANLDSTVTFHGWLEDA